MKKLAFLAILLWSLPAFALFEWPVGVCELTFFHNPQDIERDYMNDVLVGLGYENVELYTEFDLLDRVHRYRVYLNFNQSNRPAVAVFSFDYASIGSDGFGASVSIHHKKPLFVLLRKGLKIEWLTKKEMDSGQQAFQHKCHNFGVKQDCP